MCKFVNELKESVSIFVPLLPRGGYFDSKHSKPSYASGFARFHALITLLSVQPDTSPPISCELESL